MSASNTAATAASQNNPNNHTDDQRAIDFELLNAESLVQLHKYWISKCYGLGSECVDRSIQNSICVLSRSAGKHLQKAKEIANRIGKNGSYFSGLLEAAENNIKILSVPYHAIGENEVTALLLITDDFIFNVRNARSGAGFVWEKEEQSNELGGTFWLDSPTLNDYAMAIRMDLVYSFLDYLIEGIDGYLDNPSSFAREMGYITKQLRSIFPKVINESRRNEIKTVLDYFVFLEKVFDAGIKMSASDKCAICTILLGAKDDMYRLTTEVRRKQAEDLMNSGGSLHDNLLH